MDEDIDYGEQEVYGMILEEWYKSIERGFLEHVQKLSYFILPSSLEIESVLRKTNSFNIIKFLIEEKIQVFSPSIHFAIPSGNLNLVKLLCESVKGGLYQESKMMKMAVQKGFFEIFKYIESKLQSAYYQSVLQECLETAVESNRFVFVEYLIGKKILNVNSSNWLGQSLLWIACKSKDDSFKIVKCLIENNADPNQVDKDGISPLSNACISGSVDLVRYLLNQKSIEIDRADRDGQTPLFKSSLSGNLEAIKCLVEMKVDLNRKESLQGESALFPAARIGNLNVIKIFIAKEIDSHLKNKSEQSALFIAASYGHLECVKFLAELADVNLNQTDISEQSLLFIASKNGRVSVVKYLIERKVALDLPNFKGRTPLSIAYNHLEVVKLLVSFGANVDFPDEEGNCPLCFAIDKLDVFKFLVECGGANFENANKVGMTPLLISIVEGKLETLKYLLSKNAKIDRKRKLLKLALDHKRFEILHYFISNGFDEPIDLLFVRNCLLKTKNNEQIRLFNEFIEGHRIKLEEILKNNRLARENAIQQISELNQKQSESNMNEFQRVEISREIDKFQKEEVERNEQLKVLVSLLENCNFQ